MRRGYAVLFVAAAVGLAGCGSRNGLTLGTVRGKVTYEGEPVRLGYVTFMPDASTKTEGPPATGSIGEDGTFVISTEQSADGAIVGTHKVAVIALDPSPLPGQDQPKPEDDPAKFLAAKGKGSRPRSKASGGLTYTARDGKTYAVIVPERLMNPETSGIVAKVERGSNTFTIAIKEDGTAQVTD
jgi:hypothetical protein